MIISSPNTLLYGLKLIFPKTKDSTLSCISKAGFFPIEFERLKKFCTKNKFDLLEFFSFVLGNEKAAEETINTKPFNAYSPKEVSNITSFYLRKENEIIAV